MVHTLDGEHELLGVEHRRSLVLALLCSFAVASPFLALAPQVGAAVHAGNVENGNAFQRDAAQIQSNTITLMKRKRQKVWGNKSYGYEQILVELLHTAVQKV